MSIIEDYSAIARRQRQIAIEEGIILCESCKSSGWCEFYDEEGGRFYAECKTCGNPLKLKSPADSAYCG